MPELDRDLIIKKLYKGQNLGKPDSVNNILF